jgi:hypothetical protein
MMGQKFVIKKVSRPTNITIAEEENREHQTFKHLEVSIAGYLKKKRVSTVQ